MRCVCLRGRVECALIADRCSLRHTDDGWATVTLRLWARAEAQQPAPNRHRRAAEPHRDNEKRWEDEIHSTGRTPPREAVIQI